MTNQMNRVFGSWYITKNCNYSCDYCTSHDISPMKEPVAVNAIIQTINKTGRKWCLAMTGGEPFTVPDFVEMCKTLTNHDVWVAVDTNLSITHRVIDFSKRIDPDKVMYIYASTHILDREIRDGLSNFITNYLVLKNAGFAISANYVLHPRLLKRYEADITSMRSMGVNVSPRPFEGVWEGKVYPRSYSAELKEAFRKYDPEIYKKVPFYSKGLMCRAGMDLVRIKKDGTVTRCFSDGTVLGNIYTKVEIAQQALPRRMSWCRCLGMDYVEDKTKITKMQNDWRDKSGMTSGMREYSRYTMRKLMQKLGKW